MYTNKHNNKIVTPYLMYIVAYNKVTNLLFNAKLPHSSSINRPPNNSTLY